MIGQYSISVRVDIDYQPLIMELEKEEEERRIQEEKIKEERREVSEKMLIGWGEDEIQKYKYMIEEMWESQEDTLVEEKWIRLKGRVQEAVIRKKSKGKKKELGFKDWWDRECTRKKREVKRLYKRWRIGPINRERYLEGKKKMKEMQEEKKRKKRETEEKEGTKEIAK